MTRPICVDLAAPAFTVRGLKDHHRRLRKGALDAVLATAAAIEPPDQALLALGRWWAAHAASDQPIQITTTTDEVRKAAAAGDTAVILHFQGTAPLGANVDLVDAYSRLGVRVMQLTYNYRCSAGDGCLESSDAGLSAFGCKVVTRMEAVGILPDISHAGDRTAGDVLSRARGPVIATHANTRRICDSPRNLSDEIVKEVAGSGGVIGVCAFPAFVSHAPRPTLDELIDHLVSMAERVGAEHLAIGLDFADEDEADYDYYGYDERYYPRPPWRWPEGLSWWEDVPNLPAKLGTRGFSATEITGIMGENFLRVLEMVSPTRPAGL
jgi:membrane dipeptidase